MEAVEAMSQGKFCRITEGTLKYRILDDNQLQFFDLEKGEWVSSKHSLSYLCSENWEIVEEKKTLCDKKCHVAGMGYVYFEVKDVKEALKELITKTCKYLKQVKLESAYEVFLEAEAGEIFGEELLK